MAIHFVKYLAEPDIHDRIEWELKAFAVGITALGFVLRFLFNRLVRRWDATHTTVRTNVRRLDRVEGEVIDGLRDGKPFPPLEKEE